MGRWREKVETELEEADVIVAILTPESARRPWIGFETAYALGMREEKDVVPIVYFTDLEILPSPLRNLNCYRGDDLDDVKTLCGKMLEKYAGRSIRENVWELASKDYLAQVKDFKKQRLGKALFHGHFHTFDTAKHMEGAWFAKWTEIHDDGREEVFEIDELDVSTTKNRIRMVGQGRKSALYPVEGVVSSKGHVAMSYWSESDIPICGTVLLELIGGNRIMVGTWEGFTAKTLDERLRYVRGRVVMSRDREKVEGYWDLAPVDRDR
ncbi:toll/interleukin-1 receptor domain-containing protein [Gemmatimonadota bacterium]